MTSPPARPEGALLRLARQAAGLTIPDAVRLSGVSKARWSTVESGYESRGGVSRPVNAKADTIARMARAVGLTPERLESEGQRPDAAGILREILRAQPAPVAAPPVPAGAGSLTADAALIFPDDPAAQTLLVRAVRDIHTLRELAGWITWQRKVAAEGFPEEDLRRDATGLPRELGNCSHTMPHAIAPSRAR